MDEVTAGWHVKRVDMHFLTGLWWGGGVDVSFAWLGFVAASFPSDSRHPFAPTTPPVCHSYVAVHLSRLCRAPADITSVTPLTLPDWSFCFYSANEDFHLVLNRKDSQKSLWLFKVNTSFLVLPPLRSVLSLSHNCPYCLTQLFTGKPVKVRSYQMICAAEAASFNVNLMVQAHSEVNWSPATWFERLVCRESRSGYIVAHSGGHYPWGFYANACKAEVQTCGLLIKGWPLECGPPPPVCEPLTFRRHSQTVRCPAQDCMYDKLRVAGFAPDLLFLEDVALFFLSLKYRNSHQFGTENETESVTTPLASSRH